MPKKKDDYEALSLEELDQVIIDLSNERAELRERQAQAVAAYDRKYAAANAARLADNLSHPERAALLQHLKAAPVASDEGSK